MNDVDHALSQIAEMRAKLAASTRFQGFAPHIIAATGALAVALALGQSLCPDWLAEGMGQFLGYWIMLAIICALLIAGETIGRARALHHALAESMIQSIARHFLPVGATGAAISIILFRIAPDALWMLPGLWQFLVALGIFAALPSLPRGIIVAAGWYFLCGAMSLLVNGGNNLPSPCVMGIPFGIGQLLVAAILYQSRSKPL